MAYMLSKSLQIQCVLQKCNCTQHTSYASPVRLAAYPHPTDRFAVSHYRAPVSTASLLLIMIGCVIHTVYTSAGLTARYFASLFFKPYLTPCVMTDTLCLINISPLYFRGFGFKPCVKSRKI